ncbi:MAG: glycosyltransferase [Thalassobaculum sp.]
MTLPFISYGGSSLLALAFAMGMALGADPASRDGPGGADDDAALPSRSFSPPAAPAVTSSPPGRWPELLAARGHRVALVTDTRGSAFDDAAKSDGGGIEVHTIRAGGIAGRGIAAKLKSAVKLLLGWRDARRLLSRLNPVASWSVSAATPACPPLLAASGRGVPVVLHEQNAVLGRANRHAGPSGHRHRRPASEVVEKIPPQTVARSRLTGNPVREAIKGVRESGPAPLSEDGSREILLVTGGSQGASVFAELDARRRRPAARQRCAPGCVSLSRPARTRSMPSSPPMRTWASTPTCAGSSTTCRPGWRAAHLLICRAGASTVAENYRRRPAGPADALSAARSTTIRPPTPARSRTRAARGPAAARLDAAEPVGPARRAAGRHRPPDGDDRGGPRLRSTGRGGGSGCSGAVDRRPDGCRYIRCGDRRRRRQTAATRSAVA